MSQEIVNSFTGSNQLMVNTNTAKIFIGNNQTENENELNNSTYDPQVIQPGTIMGRVTGTDKVVPWRNDVSDGSQYPIGLLGAGMSIDGGASKKCLIVVKGNVAAEQIIAYQLSNQSVDTTLQLQVSIGGQLRRVKDLLEQLGLHLKYSTQMSFPDNA